jgi:hypothetical protein
MLTGRTPPPLHHPAWVTTASPCQGDWEMGNLDESRVRGRAAGVAGLVAQMMASKM